MQKNALPDPSAAEAPDLDQWQRLYEAAAAFKSLAPWDYLTDTEFIMIDLPGYPEPVFCSILGAGGLEFGVSVYPGYVAFEALERYLMPGDDEQPLMVALEQRALTCGFGDREDITPKDREILRELGLRFRGRNQWIYFRSTSPGQFPWYINAEEARLLEETFAQLLAVCRRMVAGQIEVEPTEHEYLRWYQEDGEWKSRPFPIQSIPYPVTMFNLQVTDELLLHRLKKQKRTKAVLEMEFGFLPFPVQSSKSLPPLAPFFVAVFDRSGKTLVMQHIVQGEERIEGTPAAMLIEYIQQHGKPATIYVRNEQRAGQIQQLCEDFGIRLSLSGKMHCSDEFFEMMYETLMGEFSQ